MLTSSSLDPIHGKSATPWANHRVIVDSHLSRILRPKGHDWVGEAIFLAIPQMVASACGSPTESRRNRQSSKRQALPLAFTRFLCPRSDSKTYLRGTRKSKRARPQTWQIRGLEQSVIATQPRIRRVHGLPIGAANPRSRTVRDLRHYTPWSHQNRVLAAGSPRPRRVLSLRQCASANSPQTGFVLGYSPIANGPQECLKTATRWPDNVRFHTETNPPYVRL